MTDPATSPFNVRPATPADHEAVLALLIAQLREHAIETPERRLAYVLERLLHRPHRGRVLLAVSAARPIGMAALSFVWPLEHGGRGAWLEELYVVPDRRSQGVGTTLLRAACGCAAENGVVALDLEVEADHARAAHLYAREGFRPVSRARWIRRLEPVVPAPAPAATARDGGCFCGAIRYRVTASLEDVTHCHCQLCRRTTGAPFVTWVTVPTAAFTITRGTPTDLHATPNATRTFCAACGTALTFREPARPTVVDITAGSLDDPELLVPRNHIWTSRRLPWLHIEDDLPRHPESDPAEH